MLGEDFDYEAAFYGIAAANTDVTQAGVDTRRDLFDAREGQQVGITSDGLVGMMLVLTPASAKMLVEAFDGYVEHACEAGHDMLMSIAMIQNTLLSGLLDIPQFPADVRDTTYFRHKH